MATNRCAVPPTSYKRQCSIQDSRLSFTERYSPDFMVLTRFQGSDGRGDLTSIPYFDTPVPTPSDPFRALSVHAMNDTFMSLRVGIHRHIQPLCIPNKNKKIRVPIHPRIPSPVTRLPIRHWNHQWRQVESNLRHQTYNIGKGCSFPSSKATKQLERALKVKSGTYFGGETKNLAI